MEQRKTKGTKQLAVSSPFVVEANSVVLQTWRVLQSALPQNGCIGVGFASCRQKDVFSTSAFPIEKHGRNCTEEFEDASEGPLTDDTEECDSLSGRNEKTSLVPSTALRGAGSNNGLGNKVVRQKSFGSKRVPDLDDGGEDSNNRRCGLELSTRQQSLRTVMVEREVSHRRLRGESPSVAVTVTESSNSGKLHIPTAVRRTVLESWSAVEGNLEAVGMDFFLALFEKHPHIKDLFHFGGLATADLSKSKFLKAHASTFMKTLGMALVELEDMSSLIPKMRNLGHLHTLVGVQPSDYEEIYVVLIDTIAKYVGFDKWTTETEEAWEHSYTAIVEIMKDPSRHLDVEPAEGWALWNAFVCGYIAIITPFQLANFGHVWMWEVIVHILNMVSIVTLVLDFVSGYLQRVVHHKPQHPHHIAVKHGFRPWFFLQFRFNRLVRWLGLSKFSTWPVLDATILASFLIQYLLDLNVLDLIPESLYYVVGLTRLSCVVRLVHYSRCAELASLKNSDISCYHSRRLADLFMLLLYMIHLSGCLHCVVSKLTDRGDASTFSPALPGLLESGRMVNAYLHTTYWAFVNVAGIGSYDSTPETSLEILFSILVHLVGAAMYASASGSIFAILGERAEEFKSVEEGVSSLKQFMEDCDIPHAKQETFVCGYLMTKIVAKEKTETRRQDIVQPSLPKSAEELPSHLTQELNLLSRAKAIRNHAITSMSVEFSFVVAESLTEKLTLLPGDYLFQEGEMVTRCVWMVETGVLEISIDGVSKKHLGAGDIIGLGWLATSSADSRQSACCKAHLDWVTLNGMAIADVRALGTCKLVMGITSSSQVQCLQHLYPDDISRISVSSMHVDENRANR